MTNPQDLDINLLESAYRNGFFPMPHEETGEFMWFRPEPRAIIPLDNFHVSKSLAKVIRRNIFSYTISTNYIKVMEACADRTQTWINKDVLKLYKELHHASLAHSIEVWDSSGDLVGGTYGVTIGGAFFAESMFHKRNNASKIALFFLVQHLKERNFKLLECQFMTDHLESLGAINITDEEYIDLLNEAISVPTSFVKGS